MIGVMGQKVCKDNWCRSKVILLYSGSLNIDQMITSKGGC